MNLGCRLWVQNPTYNLSSCKEILNHTLHMPLTNTYSAVLKFRCKFPSNTQKTRNFQYRARVTSKKYLSSQFRRARSKTALAPRQLKKFYTKIRTNFKNKTKILSLWKVSGNKWNCTNLELPGWTCRWREGECSEHIVLHGSRELRKVVIQTLIQTRPSDFTGASIEFSQIPRIHQCKTGGLGFRV